MNEPIEKLFEQALAEFKAENKYATIVEPDPIQRDFVEKFARLIVKECAEICLEANDHKNILRHFGVEEPKEQSDSDRILSTIRTRGLKDDGR